MRCNDAHGDDGRYYRNLKEAELDFSGYLEKITIETPITKDTVIALLNREGFVSSSETVKRKPKPGRAKE